MPWIALVGPEIEENLALRYLASALSAAGYESRILPFNAARDLGTVVRRVRAASTPPLLVAVSLAFQWRAEEVMALVLALRESGYEGHITGGGHFGTFAAREILEDFPELDSICRHEAEHTLVALVQAVDRGGSLQAIPGLALWDGEQVVLTELPEPPDLGALPWPDRRGEPMRCLGHGVAPLVASRGCYASCDFCCIAAWHREAKGALRWRVRPADDVAAEMATMHHEHGIDVFIFHDDDFFVPSHGERVLDRIHAIADGLEARSVGPMATVVKARPNDVRPEVFQVMRDRLGLNRVFLGVETNSTQGLRTLGRGVKPGRNDAAMAVLETLGIYVCFNMLVFDPDAGFEELETNLEFMEAHASEPSNFGRVELYAGTPLLARMQAEGRARGDYMGWDYRLATPEMERVFRLFLKTLGQRNFSESALANRLMGTRFDVEVARSLHPAVFQQAWLDEAKGLSRRLVGDSVQVMRKIMDFVRADGPNQGSFLEGLKVHVGAVDQTIEAEARALEETVQRTVGRRCRHMRPADVAA